VSDDERWVRALVLAAVIGVMIFLAAGVYFATQRFLGAERGQPFGVESHWGGLGGGLGGWRVSPQVIYLVAALVFAGMLTALASRTLDVLRPAAPPPTADSRTSEADDADTADADR
jgi:hypothetical protein